ncbi:DUF6151 family protein [Shimia sp. FJ5]|uniref:DUF6151 family protein n=1 Tax=Shimia sp. FJ5 TaxID=3079054 RepID=UPI002611BE31|nr:DUF6151 family protein [Shimia sp. FJ5]MDV4143677.1 DUF6151 family protein [Shimia sp. FJ5]
MGDIPFSCTCGTVNGRLVDIDKKAGSRITCYCKDCQTAAHALGRSDLLNARGGSDIYQTTPAHIRIDEGATHVACLRLSPKGLMRWYAECCNTPLFNTLPSPKLCFSGVLVHTVAEEARDPLGPLTAETFTEGATGEGPPVRKYGFARTGFNIMRRHLRAKLGRAATMAPFFDADGAATCTPRVLTLEERNAACPD